MTWSPVRFVVDAAGLFTDMKATFFPDPDLSFKGYEHEGESTPVSKPISAHGFSLGLGDPATPKPSSTFELSSTFFPSSFSRTGSSNELALSTLT